MTDPYGENYNFALIGAGGYIAPKHLQAIKNVGGNLISALDPNDSVGVLDKYFIDTSFFTEEKEFINYTKNKVQYVSICSPNYMHKPHIEQSLALGANVICEKPLVLNDYDLQEIMDLEKKYNKKVHSILQLRLHPSILKLKKEIENNNKKYKVNLKYITPRGGWYFRSWKGNAQKSGGLLMNIGVHLFDILLFLFGKYINFSIIQSKKNKIEGTLELERASVNWFLSIDKNDSLNQKTHRVLSVDNVQIDMSESFADLHTNVYENILNEGGFGTSTVLESLRLIYKIGEYSDNKSV